MKVVAWGPRLVFGNGITQFHRAVEKGKAFKDPSRKGGEESVRISAGALCGAFGTVTLYPEGGWNQPHQRFL